MENCYICKISFVECDDVGECDICSVRFHIKCIGMKKIEFNAYTGCRHLHLYCNECHKDGISKEVINRVLNFVIKIDMQNQQIKSDNNEMLCNITAKLNELNEKYATINNKVESLSVQSPILSNTQSYANTVKVSNIKPSVVIKPKVKQQSKKTLKDIKDKIDTNDYKVCSTRNIHNGGLLLHCDNPRETVKVQQIIKEKCGDEYEIILPKMKKPRLRITNIDDELPTDSIVNELKRHNQIMRDMNIDVITTIKKSKRGFTSIEIVIETDMQNHKKLLEIGAVHLPWRECKVFEHLHLKRCYKCCGFSHISSECKHDQKCSRCAGAHKYTDCNNNRFECVNCKSANEKYNLKLNIKHHAWSKECSVLQKRFDSMRNYVEYSESK